MEMKTLLTLLLAVVLLAGCASGARTSEMVYSPSEPVTFDDNLDKQVEVRNVMGGKKTNPAWSSQIGNESFAGAVKQTLSDMNLLGEDGRYSLDITLHEVQQPMMGFDLEVATHIQYVIRDTDFGDVVMDETIVAHYTATVNDAFSGVKRLKLANEGSAKENIKQFVEALARLEIEPGEISVSN